MRPLHHNGVADAGQHIGDGIGEHIRQSSPYQLALRTPGIKPWSANLRKQIRQMPNLR
jgi:hypothetical protein